MAEWVCVCAGVVGSQSSQNVSSNLWFHWKQNKQTKERNLRWCSGSATSLWPLPPPEASSCSHTHKHTINYTLPGWAGLKTGFTTSEKVWTFSSQFLLRASAVGASFSCRFWSRSPKKFKKFSHYLVNRMLAENRIKFLQHFWSFAAN